MAAFSPRSSASASAATIRSTATSLAKDTVAKRIVRTTAALAIALLILGQGISAPFQKDAEPQSAQWIADIVQNGNWMLPHDYYDFIDRKPPLFYWLSAIVAKSTGNHVDETRARAVSLIAGAALAAEVMAWSAAQFGQSGGWLAFAFLIGTYGFASRATTALTDMLMTLLLFSIYLIIAPQIDGIMSWRRTAFAGILLGLAILTKGPVAFVLLALAVFIYMLLIRGNPLILAMRRWPWLMLTIAVVIAAAWYIPAFMAGRVSGFAGVFVNENFGHFMPASMGGTGEAARPIYYIVMRLIGGAMPLSLLIPALAAALIPGGFAADARRPIMLQLAMALAVILLFSAASAKRDDYILPALPPMAILFAGLFTSISRESVPTRVATILRDGAVALIAIAMLAGTIGLLVFVRAGGHIGSLDLHLQSSDASYAAILAYGLARMSAPFAIFVAAVLAGATMALVALWRKRTIVSGAGVALMGIAATVLWTGTLRPAEASTRSLGTFAAEVKGRVGDAPVYVAYDDPEFAWYYGRGVPALPKTVARFGPPAGDRVYLVARPRELSRLAPDIRRGLVTIIQSHVLGGGGPPALYEIDPVDGLNPASGSIK